MRICLLSTAYPPTSTEGIARQRQVLAAELARRGHDVHVITCGTSSHTTYEQGVWVHEISLPPTNRYSELYGNLDAPLTRSQILYEELQRLIAKQPFDIVDTPLWSAPGFVTLQRYKGPTVLWLQTSSAQLLQINGGHPKAEDYALPALEKICVERANGILADSGVALEAVLRDYQVQPAVPTAVAHLGLPPLRHQAPARQAKLHVEALVVGRLERRKGTPLLFDLLPALLHQHPQLNVRFVGRDNSRNDGWQTRHGMTYIEYFWHHHPHLAQRVIFEGYVDDKQLELFYRQADLMLVSSLYESFGLIYLEAMRAALPVVTFAAGGANEIFVEGEDHGALLVAPQDRSQLAAAISRLIQEPHLRQRLGERGLARFNTTFNVETMAEATLDLYAEVIAHYNHEQPHIQTVYQVMEALDVGDAVSNITRRNAGLLAELGQAAPILVRYAHESIKHETLPMHHALTAPECGLIFHYWGYNSAAWILQAIRGPKAIYYHNITPPHYFAPDSNSFHHTTKGYTQLRQIADSFELLIGDSHYNITELAQYISEPKPGLHIYPVVDVAEMQSGPCDNELLASLRRPGDINILFVGRIARNKRQDQLMRLFDYYYREINRHARLWLVGNDRGDIIYRAELEQLRESLAASERIMFTGKVSEAQLNAYYHAADVFICASEHEGFCIPLIQAMALDVPVLAYAATAVPETMGVSGILINEWEVARVAELMHLALTDRELREHLLAGQCANLSRFSSEEASKRLAAVIRYLRTAEPSPLFEWYGLPINNEREVAA